MFIGYLWILVEAKVSLNKKRILVPEKLSGFFVFQCFLGVNVS